MYATTHLYIYQSFALNGANLFCDSGVTCYIYCYSDGCFNISSATGSGTYLVNCASNLISNILCPDESDLAEVNYHLTNIDFENDLPSILVNQLLINSNKDDNIFDIGDTMCKSDTNGVLEINCADDSECSGAGTQSYLNKAVCCGGYNGCYNPFISTTINSFSGINYPNDTLGIRCGGYQSCRDSSSISSSTDHLEIIGENYDETSGQTVDIHCGAYISCYHTILTGLLLLFLLSFCLFFWIFMCHFHVLLF